MHWNLPSNPIDLEQREGRKNFWNIYSRSLRTQVDWRNITFLESQDFEDAIRNAVSLGGDTDTLGTITGSIAEAFYGIPAVLVAECRSRLDEGLMTDVLDEFDHALGRDRNVDSDDKNGTPGKVLWMTLPSFYLHYIKCCDILKTTWSKPCFHANIYY